MDTYYTDQVHFYFKYTAKFEVYLYYYSDVFYFFTTL